MKQKSIKINFIMNALLSVSAIVFSMVTYPYVMRILLPEGMGKIASAISLIEVFNIFAQLGIPTYGIRACAKVRDDRAKLSKVVQELFIVNISMTAVTYVILVAVILVVPSIRQEKALYLVTALTILLSALGMEWLYKALEKYTYITLRSLLFKVISIVAMFLLVKSEKDYVIYGGIAVFATYGSLVLNFLGIYKYIDIKPQKDLHPYSHIKSVGIFLAMACATTVYTNLDKLMLKAMTSYSDVGLYEAAVKIKIVVLSIITSLGAVLLPRLSYYVENNMMKEFKEVTRKALSFVMIVAGGAALFFIINAKWCILLLSGIKYEGAIVPMQIIITTVLIIGISNILGMQVLVPLGKEKALLYIEIAGAVTNVVANLIFIPMFRASGAAIGTVLAELVVTISLIVYLRNELKGCFRVSSILKVLISLGAAGIASLIYYKYLTEYIIYLVVLIVGLLEDMMPINDYFDYVVYIFILGFSFVVFCVTYLGMLLLTREQFIRELIGGYVKRLARKKS